MAKKETTTKLLPVEIRQCLKPSSETIQFYQQEWMQLNREDAAARREQKEEGEEA